MIIEVTPIREKVLKGESYREEKLYPGSFSRSLENPTAISPRRPRSSTTLFLGEKEKKEINSPSLDLKERCAETADQYIRLKEVESFYRKSLVGL